jgi:hypothetical protein
MEHDKHPISDEGIVALAKAAIELSRDDVAAGRGRYITIDLGHKNIARLPDEVIDIIRAGIERYVL